MLRGNAGRLIFLDDIDRTRFCLILQKAAEEYQLNIHAFCFMGNHAHFIFEPTTYSLSKIVHAFAGRYALYFNRRYKQRGHLFQDRFRSIVIEDSEYLKCVVRYIHLNPIRAQLVSRPEAYLWSSFCSYLGHGEVTWLKHDRILRKFGTTDLEARQNMASYTSKIIDAELDVSNIRVSNQIGAYGSEEFIKQFVNVEVDSAMIKIQLTDLMAVAQVEFGFSCSEISSDSRERRLVDIRSILALAVQKAPGLSLQQLAHYLNRDSSSLCRLVKRAKESQELETKADKLLRVTLSSKSFGDGSA